MTQQSTSINQDLEAARREVVKLEAKIAMMPLYAKANRLIYESQLSKAQKELNRLEKLNRS